MLVYIVGILILGDNSLGQTALCSCPEEATIRLLLCAIGYYRDLSFPRHKMGSEGIAPYSLTLGVSTVDDCHSRTPPDGGLVSVDPVSRIVVSG